MTSQRMPVERKNRVHHSRSPKSSPIRFSPEKTTEAEEANMLHIKQGRLKLEPVVHYKPGTGTVPAKYNHKAVSTAYRWNSCGPGRQG